MWNFPLIPEQASSFASNVDALMAFLLLITTFFSTLIAGLIIYFSFKYHHSAKADRSNPVNSHLLLEIVWSAIPLGIVLVVFVWGAKVFYEMKTIPQDAMEIFVVGRQWMWKVQHPQGQREINALHVPVGRRIRLTMISEDVIHNFAIPAFRIRQDVLPGRYSQQWFEATKPGRYHLFCSEYCGTLHAGMVGQVVAMEPSAFERWLSGGTPTSGSMVASGDEIFKKLGCGTCHLASGEGRGPAMKGLYGSRVALAGGQSVLADEAYLRESLLRPNAKLVRGYQPIMPTYQNQLDEEQVLQLIAYMKGLK
jgi:cytochrome c oxidase subunit 2